MTPTSAPAEVAVRLPASLSLHPLGGPACCPRRDARRRGLLERPGARNRVRARGLQPCIGVRVWQDKRDSLPVAATPGSVVATKLVAIRLLLVPTFVELGSVLDLFLGAVDVNYLVFAVYPGDHTGRQHDLLAEDPWPRINDQPACARLVVGPGNLTNTPILGFDRPPGQIPIDGSLIGVPPHVYSTHQPSPSFTSVVADRFKTARD